MRTFLMPRNAISYVQGNEFEDFLSVTSLRKTVEKESYLDLEFNRPGLI